MATPTTAPNSPAQAALKCLRPLRPLLAGFNHRNRNQHHAARWWAEFGMLRRHVGKLVAELEGDVRGAEKALSRRAVGGGKAKSTTTEGGAVSGKQGLGNELEGNGSGKESAAGRRAAWLRDVLVQRCYEAFSQLAADNQFATLGVVLLAVLADVNRACVELVGPSRADGSGANDSVLAAVTPVLKASAGSGAVAEEEGVLDVGQVVSREDIAVGATPGELAGSGAKRRKQSSINDEMKPRKEAEAALPPPRKARSAKKQKKAKKGDEFDDLFSSLF